MNDLLRWMGLTGLWLLCACQAHAMDIWPRLHIVVAQQAFTPDQAWAQAQLNTALQLRHAHQVVGPANSPAHWAAWSMQAEEFQHSSLWLSLQSPTQDHSALWVRHGQGPWRWVPDMNSQAQGWGGGYLTPTWLLTAPQDRVDLLMRIEGPNRVQFPLVVHPPLEYLMRQQRMVLFMGAVLAVPLVVMVYALGLIRSLPNRQLPLFLGMAICELLAALWVSGMLSLLWPTLSRLQAAWVGSLAYWVLFVLSIFHAQSFLNTAQSRPRVHRLLTGLAGVWLSAVPVGVIFWPQWLRAMLLWGGSVHAVLMLMLTWRSDRPAKPRSQSLYAGIWLVYSSSVLVYWLYRWLEWPLFTTLGVQFVQGAAVASLMGLLVSLQIMDERQQLQQQLLIGQARSRWVASAQHDLWQPLQSIQLYAQALLSAPAAHHHKLVNGLQLASQSVDDFMKHLRFFTDGIPPTNPVLGKEVHIDQVLLPLVSEFRPLAHMRHVVLRHRPCDACVHIHTPSFQRLVRNLLSNALHYTPAGGRVLLACQKRGELLWFLCIDNGTGMSPAQLADCFNAFTRFEPSDSSDQHLGLGLFSVKQLAMQHHWPTRLQSEVGRGTLVGVGLPLTDKPTTA